MTLPAVGVRVPGLPTLVYRIALCGVEPHRVITQHPPSPPINFPAPSHPQATTND